MRRKIGILGAALLFASVIVPRIGADASASDGRWITVDRVLVNKLGGVSVEGRHSCAFIYDQLLGSGITVWYEDSSGNWQTKFLTADTDDEVVVHSNADNYTVSQPAGRHSMIRVTHESSRANPCFTTDPDIYPGIHLPCAEDGCRWATDNFDYEGPGPLFDYSPNGKFKPGSINVSGLDVGYYIEIWNGTTLVDTGTLPGEAYFNVTTKAVVYR